MKHLYGCHNRAPFKPHRGQDGWLFHGVMVSADEEAAMYYYKAVTIPQTMAKDCQYTLSELGKTDSRCIGCIWKYVQNNSESN